MIRRLATAAAAAMLLAAAPGATAGAQVAQLPVAQAEQGAKNIALATQVNARAAQLVAALDQTGIAQAASVEEYVAALDGMAPQIAAARRELARMHAELRALPRVGGEDAPVQLRAIDHIIDDSGEFLQRIDGMLAAYSDVADGFRGNDRGKAERALATLAGATMTLVDGQALMLRGRATLVGSDRSDYAHAEGLACLYDGMAVLMRLRLQFIEPAAAADTLRTARVCVADQVELGRAALLRESADRSANPTARALEVRLAEISDRIFAKIEEGGGLLEESLTVIKDGAAEEAVEAQLARFIQFEVEVAALGEEQGRSLIARSPG